jgi:hypothetical protein
LLFLSQQPTADELDDLQVNVTMQGDLLSRIHFKSGVLTPLGFSDWQSHLTTRGFEDMIEDWLLEVKNNSANLNRLQSILASHQLCEKLVEQVSLSTNPRSFANSPIPKPVR